jgi:hypothetical protein
VCAGWRTTEERCDWWRVLRADEGGWLINRKARGVRTCLKPPRLTSLHCVFLIPTRSCSPGVRVMFYQAECRLSDDSHRTLCHLPTCLRPLAGRGAVVEVVVVVVEVAATSRERGSSSRPINLTSTCNTWCVTYSDNAVKIYTVHTLVR